ncbi:DUF4247 domain-containing protein [Streptomyces chumphonensis]|uniref:DUF4247 domain-containing protein n=1 Tax=Streptomyces chumphonensis TaxID=1214925 RepID=UPI003D759DF7
MKPARPVACTALAAALLLTGCSGGNDAREVPRGWIAEEYGRDGLDYVDRGDGPSKVAGEIDDHRSAVSRTTSGGRVFLRYRDDIVAVSPHLGGSRIEIDDYRDGYNRWHSHVGHVWPAPGSSGNGFRGGGPGSGK